MTMTVLIEGQGDEATLLSPKLADGERKGDSRAFVNAPGEQRATAMHWRRSAFHCCAEVSDEESTLPLRSCPGKRVLAGQLPTSSNPMIDCSWPAHGHRNIAGKPGSRLEGPWLLVVDCRLCSGTRRPSMYPSCVAGLLQNAMLLSPQPLRFATFFLRR